MVSGVQGDVTSVVVVDLATGLGGPAALLPDGHGRCLLDATLARIEAAGVPACAVLTRSAWSGEVKARVGDSCPVLSFDDVADGLRSLAQLLDDGMGPVLVLHADIVCHPSAIDDVVHARGHGTVALAGPGGCGPLRIVEGEIVDAGSDVHAVEVSDSTNLGVLRIAAGDRSDVVRAMRAAAGPASDEHWDADLVDVLLVSIVRSGLPVAAVRIGGLAWSRPRDARQAEQSVQRVESTDEHRVRLWSSARPNDGFYSTFVVRRLSKWVTAAAIKVGATPNQITVASLLIGLATAGCFAVGTRGWLIAGAVLLQVSLVVDCADGEVARYTRRFSPLGAWLDATSDRVKEFAVYAALALGAARTGDGVWTLAAATLALQTFRHMVDFGFEIPNSERKATMIAQLRSPKPVHAAATSRADDTLPGGPAISRAAVALSETTSRVPALVWAKRVVIMPIGERWLVISVAAAVSGARAVFVALLVLGAIAALYTVAGRVLRTAGWRGRAARRGPLDYQLDAGPLAGSLLRRAGRTLGERLGWLAPAVARAVEYSAVIALAATRADDAMPAAYALLAAVAYHHYDIAYRLRHTRTPPGAVTFIGGLGFDGRLLVVGALAVAGGSALRTGLWVLAAVLGALFLVESVVGWTRWLRSPAASPALETSAA